ncbi:serine/threonine-protein kinase [Nocardioides sp.]|uniref:serine/threonine-protein kinase n=1 Tax=Nocardioides sp. TaxID=35761 RepID=UPI0031FE5320|nr:Serine/threonine protein kinase [Nocardioides sp.]
MSLPERLGRLQRVDRLGVGGFATVWLYHDAELRSDVAVKALADNWAQRLDVRERFLEEARILRRADSDHIVRVYDVGEADGTPYFVMTYADLGSLAALLEPEEPLPHGQVMDLVAQAGAGLSVLHEHGVVHRDIKPQNLLLRSGGSAGDRLLVADLGVAKAMLHASGLTQVVGTPSYMAPEQATGGGIDRRADVHALGAVAYQMLTGRLARDVSIGELAHASLPAAPSSFVDVSSAVDDVLLRALQPDPEHRWKDVDSFVAALRAALPSAPVPAPTTLTHWETPETVGTLTQSHAEPRRPLVPLLMLCLLVFAAMFGAGYAITTILR